MTRIQSAASRAQPLDLNLAVARGAGRRGERLDPPAQLPPDAVFEVRAVGPEHAAQAAQPDPQIMQRLDVAVVGETLACVGRGAEVIERQPAAPFLDAHAQQSRGLHRRQT